jgi:phospholysine phosphohistidine inorganic pyrophosphate phosphatase
MRAVLFDLDGVFYEGDKAIEGAAQVVAWLQERKMPHLFLTNTTSRPRSALVEKLAGFGVQVDEARILSPPVVAVHWLKKNISGEVALFVPEATQAEFADLAIAPEEKESAVGAVVIGDLARAWDFAKLNRAFRLLMSEPRPELIALGKTLYTYDSDGLRLDTAPFVAALEQAAGVTARVLGKPAPLFFQAALEMLRAEAAGTVMVGDDIHSDVEGAQKAGLRGVLVKTGKFQPRDLTGDIKPHAVLDSIADFPHWWEENKEA